MIDFLKINPNDGCPWLGLLMIHSDYKGYGFGTQAYLLFENKMREKNLNKMRLGVLKDNLKAHGFWESLGYRFYQSVKNENGKEIMCYEKELT